MADFSSKDFSTRYEAMLDFIEHLTTRWSPKTSSEADPGVVLLKAYATEEEVQEYAWSAARNQGYLDGVTNKQDAFDLLQSFGYSMKSNKSASGQIQLTVMDTSKLDGIEAIPARTVFTDVTGNKTYFSTKTVSLLDESKLIRISESRAVNIDVLEGNPFQITKEGVDVFTLKDIDESGRFFLQRTGLAANGVFIYPIAEGEELPTDWTLVDSSAIFPTGKYFTLRTSTTGEDYIQFPFNFDALVGSMKFTVYATYSSGVSGAVPKNTIVKAPSLSSTFVVNQAEATGNGQDAQTIRQAIEEYYRTKELFNALVSHHDYEAAIRLLDVSQRSLFPACWADTEVSRQQIIKARTYALTYFYYQPDTAFPPTLIRVLKLKASSDYSKSYSVEDSVEVQTELNKLLHQVKELGANIELATSPRILAVTALKGDIKYTEIEELAPTILTKISTSYNSTSAYFGKEIDYEELLLLLKAINPQIVSVALDMLKYQVYLKYSEVDGVTEQIPITASDRLSLTEVAARSVLKGDVPLFRYLNRRNASSKDLAGYTPIILGTGNFKRMELTHPTEFFVGNKHYAANDTAVKFNPTVKSISPNFGSLEVTDGKRTLIKSQVLQLNKPIMKTSIEYGQGVKYAFNSKKVALTANKQRSSYTYLLAESELKGYGTAVPYLPSSLDIGNAEVNRVNGTFIVPTEGIQLQGEPTGRLGTVGLDNTIAWATKDEVISKKIVRGTVVLLKDNYTLRDTLYLANSSVIVKGSIPIDGSVINGEIQGSSLLPDKEYQLKDDQTITLKASESSENIIYKKGTWVKVSGTTLKSLGEVDTGALKLTPLTSGQSISILERASYDIGTEYLYFIKLKGNKKTLDLTSDKGYMLDDGEFFVYTNASKTEYIQLGSGTVLTFSKAAKNKVAEITKELDNILPIDIEESPTLFKSLPFIVTAAQTETVTLQAGDTVKIENGDALFTGTNLPHEFTPLGISETSTATITHYKEDSTEDIYTFPYSLRMVCVFISNTEGLIEVPHPIVLTLQANATAASIPIGKEFTLKPANHLGIAYLAVSTPTYFVAEANAPLFKEGSEEYVCAFSARSAVDVPTGVYSALDVKGNSVKFTVQKELSVAGSKRIPLPLLPTAKAILARVHIKFKGVKTTGGSVSFYTSSYDAPQTAAPARDMYSSTEANYVITSNITSLDSILVIPAFDYSASINSTNAGGAQLEVRFSGGGGWEGTEVVLYDVSYIDDFSRELQYTQENTNAADYYNPMLKLPKSSTETLMSADKNLYATPLLEKLKEIDKQQEFDYLCDPSIPYEYPTASASYFNKEHPFNRKTIAYISLQETKESLKLTRRR